MEDGQQPATKQDLLELEQRTKQDLLELEQRLEERLTELIRDTETNLLRAFYGFAEVTQKHLVDLDRSDSSLRERLGTIEIRLTEVEKRLNMPPVA